MNSRRKLTISLSTLVLLCVMLGITGFALGMTVIRADNDLFQTGLISIDLNGGRPVFEDGEFVFEPGATIEKQFYIQNNGSGAVYYKLYFSSVSGSLGDAVEVTVLDKGGRVLLEGRLTELTRGSVPAVEDELAVDERRELVVRFAFPSDCGNVYQGGELSFELSALAVQTKNNPNKEFD